MASIEEISFVIISAAGEAQSTMMGALGMAREGNIAEALEEMKKADKMLLTAHKSQTALITKEAQGERSEYSILMVHAQDHLMNAMLSKQLIREMIHMYEEMGKLK